MIVNWQSHLSAHCGVSECFQGTVVAPKTKVRRMFVKRRNLYECRQFASQIRRPFGLRYNPYTQSVEVLTDAQKITAVVSELRGDLCIVSNALRKIHEQDETVNVERITSLLTQGIDLQLENSPTSSSGSDFDDKSPNRDEKSADDAAGRSNNSDPRTSSS